MSGKKILICDDDRDISDVTTIILRENGFVVKTIHNCNTIIRDIEEFEPDLILMDLRIPKKGGEIATREIKSNYKTRDIPVLIFTANHHAVQIANEIGADGLITKPYDIEGLVEKINSYNK